MSCERGAGGGERATMSFPYPIDARSRPAGPGVPLHQPPPRARKTETLRERGVLHPHPQRVRDPLFVDQDFFDPRDLLLQRAKPARLGRE